MRDEFRYESGLDGRFRDRYRLRRGRDESYGGFAVSSNPTQGASVTHVIVGLERGALGFFTDPMHVRETSRMLMRWIAIVDVKKRSLSEGEQQARGDAKMEYTPHFLTL